jgi:hypothetical protein
MTGITIYPSRRAVQAADADALVRWNRHLRSPRDRVEAQLMSEIQRRLRDTPRDEKRAASKRVGYHNKDPRPVLP